MLACLLIITNWIVLIHPGSQNTNVLIFEMYKKWKKMLVVPYKKIRKVCYAIKDLQFYPCFLRWCLKWWNDLYQNPVHQAWNRCCTFEILWFFISFGQRVSNHQNYCFSNSSDTPKVFCWSLFRFNDHLKSLFVGNFLLAQYMGLI